MKLSAALAVTALGLVLSGCATIIDGSSEKIGITTGEVTGAQCSLSNGAGHWSVVTPGKVKVERSKHDMKVVCSKPGLADATATIPSDLNGWALVNFAILDLPGLGVDAATGAINDYDDTTHVRMTQGYGAGNYGAPPQQAYPSYPAQTQAPPPQTPPAYMDNSQYPQPAQGYDDQSQMYPDQSQMPPDQSQTYPDQSQSYPDQSQSYPSQPQSYPDNSQSNPSGGSEAGSLPPL